MTTKCKVDIYSGTSVTSWASQTTSTLALPCETIALALFATNISKQPQILVNSKHYTNTLPNNTYRIRALYKIRMGNIVSRWMIKPRISGRTQLVGAVHAIVAREALAGAAVAGYAHSVVVALIGTHKGLSDVDIEADTSNQ
jgi:hypothetical protein